MTDVAGLMVLEKRNNQFLVENSSKDYSDKPEMVDEHIKTI